jgi:hypothetical protein
MPLSGFSPASKRFSAFPLLLFERWQPGCDQGLAWEITEAVQLPLS